jgi:peptidoglycan/LPS O-acetylase OafA/YrhL
MKQHFQQIDVLKCAAIIAVIALHTLSKSKLIQTFAVFHIWQAVPVFMVIMGLNLGLSLKNKQVPFSSLYTKEYFSKKATRILVPFIITFLIALLIGLYWQFVYNKHILIFNKLTLIGLLPIPGEGNYFITLLLQTIFVLPLVGFLFHKHRIYTSVGLVLLEVIFLVLSKHFDLFDDSTTYIYSAALPRYFSAIVYGLWLSKAITKPFKWWAILTFAILACISIIYLYSIIYSGFNIPYIYKSWASQNVISFGYAALLVLLFIYALPIKSSNSILQVLTQIGYASYHIFLVQVVYFGLPINHKNLLLNLSICIVLGYLFYRAEKLISTRRLSTTNQK